MLWQPGKTALNRAEREGTVPEAPPTPIIERDRVKTHGRRETSMSFERDSLPRMRGVRQDAMPTLATLPPGKKRGPKARGDGLTAAQRKAEARKQAGLERIERAAVAFAPIMAAQERVGAIAGQVRAIELGIERDWLALQPPERPRIRASDVLPGLIVCACRDYVGIGTNHQAAWHDWKRQAAPGADVRIPHSIR